MKHIGLETEPQEQTAAYLATKILQKHRIGEGNTRFGLRYSIGFGMDLTIVCEPNKNAEGKWRTPNSIYRNGGTRGPMVTVKLGY